jgi:virginiamycin B lyase
VRTDTGAKRTATQRFTAPLRRIRSLAASSQRPSPSTPADPADLRFFAMPTPFSGPTVITAGPDGAAWTMQMFANQIARIDPITGDVREYPIPWGPTCPRPHTSPGPGILPAGFTSLSCTIKPGADGNIYFTNGIRNQIGQLNPSTGAVQLFTPRGRFGGLFPLTDLSSSADAIWFSQTVANRIGRFDLSTHQFRDYIIPTRASMPVGVFSCSDGSVCFAETAANKIGLLDPSTGHITEHRLPQSLSGPFVINGETEGRYVWFTQMSGNRIARLDLHTTTIDRYSVPLRASFPTEVCAGPDGNIYFTHLIRNGIGRLNPRDGSVTNIAIPTQQIVSRWPIKVRPRSTVGICSGPGNAIWFTWGLGNKVGRIALN